MAFRANYPYLLHSSLYPSFINFLFLILFNYNHISSPSTFSPLI
jgi:hypothetical protein